MTSKPFFSRIVPAVLFLGSIPLAWAGDMQGPCTGGRVYHSLLGDWGSVSERDGCEEDVPAEVMRRHGQDDPFGRKPHVLWKKDTYVDWVENRVTTQWYQDGHWHSLRVTRYTRPDSPSMSAYLTMSGSNGSDEVRLQKYKRRFIADPKVGIRISTGGGDDVVHGTNGTDTIRPYHEEWMRASMYPLINGREMTLSDLSALYLTELGCWESTAQRECERLTNTGAKTYYGRGGDDYLQGGSDGDRLYGGNGADRVFGGGGADHLYGGGGDDRLYGGDGGDHLVGGLGRDELYGQGGNDRLDGGRGATCFTADGDRTGWKAGLAMITWWAVRDRTSWPATAAATITTWRATGRGTAT